MTSSPQPGPAYIPYAGREASAYRLLWLKIGAIGSGSLIVEIDGRDYHGVEGDLPFEVPDDRPVWVSARTQRAEYVGGIDGTLLLPGQDYDLAYDHNSGLSLIQRPGPTLR